MKAPSKILLFLDILHFGQQVLIFKYFPAKCLIKLLPSETCWELYEFLFSTIRNDEKGTEQFLIDLAAVIQEYQASQAMDNENRKLLLITIETLSSITGPCAKRMRSHLETFLSIFAKYMESHFNNSNDGTSKKDKKFVLATLSGFASYASVILAKASKVNEETDNQKETKDDTPLTQAIDENFRRISKIYIGHSVRLCLIEYNIYIHRT